MRLVIKRRNNRVIIINLLYSCSPHRKAQHDIDTCTGAGRNYCIIFLDSFIIALEFLFRVVWVLFCFSIFTGNKNVFSEYCIVRDQK